MSRKNEGPASVVNQQTPALATGLGWIGVVTFWSILVRRDQARLSPDA